MADDPSQEQGSAVEEPVRQLFRQGRFADAVPVIQEHLEAEPTDAYAYELMADALKYAGDKGGCAAALTRASEVWAGLGRTIESIAAQKKAVKLGVDPDFSKIRGADAPVRVETPLLDDLADDEFASLVQKLDSRTFTPGDVIVKEGESGDTMFVVVRGRVEVVLGSGATEKELAQLGAGEFFGESALLSGRPRTATVRAAVATECLALSRADFEEVATSHPRVREVVEDFNRRRAEATVATLMGRKPDEDAS